MGGVITPGNFPHAFVPFVRAWFGMAYQGVGKQWPHLFDYFKTDRLFEEEAMGSGFGLAQQKPYGQSVVFDTESQGYIVRYGQLTYALGFEVAWEEVMDNLYPEVGKRRTERLAYSLAQTYEVVLANTYNRAFNSSYPGGDGVALCSNAHPTSVGNMSNVLEPNMDLSEFALESLLVMISTNKSDRGHPTGIRPTKLIVPPWLYFEALRILKSTWRPGTADNDINAIAVSGLLEEGVVVNNYLTDPDAFFVRTNCPHGLKVYERMAPTIVDQRDIGNLTYQFVGAFRIAWGWSDWRGLFGSPGA